ncbi:MAG: 3-isopropylmalate dehydratase small subunit [Spirochaetales bacterium]|jgi:3-isopropylmalate/(R)-2-methylmalate dehydratase small subunit|nr:3-isopropylmalate dehydratase small subunit [Spirochaetales bacterium]
MKDFNGPVLFLDRSDINTDEIIPARYLNEISREALKPYLMEDLKLPAFSPEALPGRRAVVSRRNFGCGSSREHAPWALEVNGIHIVVAVNFARIFRQNMFNCGMMAVELPENQIEEIFQAFSQKETLLETDLPRRRLTFSSQGKTLSYDFHLSDFDRRLLESGGWVEFAEKNY